MKHSSKIFVAGHRGMVGDAVVRNLQSKGYTNLVFRTKNQLDLTDQIDVKRFFASEKPEYVFVCAAKVGGIKANDTYRADFIHDNIIIQDNIISNAHETGVKKLLFLGSSCIYPKYCMQPIKEETLLTAPLEPTNEPYAIAKIAGIKTCESYRRQYGCNFICAMPTNLYGYGDTYDLDNAHVVPSLIMKFHHAVMHNSPFVEIWGSGRPRREFMHVDDCADALVFLMENYNEEQIVNVGTGVDISISQLAYLLRDISGYKGDIRFNTINPDGTMQKLLDVSKLNDMGWRHKKILEDGIRQTYQEYADRT